MPKDTLCVWIFHLILIVIGWHIFRFKWILQLRMINFSCESILCCSGHTRLKKWQSFMNCSTITLLARSDFNYCHIPLPWPSSLKLARAQQPQQRHESMCTDDCFSSFPRLYSVQKHIGGVAVASWHFLRGLHFIIEFVSYTHTHANLYLMCCGLCSCLVSEVIKPGIFSRQNGRRCGAQMIFEKQGLISTV